MTFHSKMFIDGSWTDASDGAVDQVPAPTTGESFAEIAHGTVTDVDRAVAAAHAAFGDWARTPAGERARAFLKLADRIEDDARTLAEIESRNVGKPIGLALEEMEMIPIISGSSPVPPAPWRAARQVSSSPARPASSAATPGRRRVGGTVELPTADGDLEDLACPAHR